MPKSFFVEVMGCRLEIVQDDDGKFIVPVGFRGLGGALKPAFEPALLFRKPLAGTVAENVMAHGTGALNIDGCRVPTTDSLGGGMVSMGRPKTSGGWDRPWMHDKNVTERKKTEAADKVALAESLGRFPANLIHDGSDEVLALFPDSDGAGPSLPRVKVTGYGGGIGTGASDYLGGERIPYNAGSGSAARFFYCPKASRKDRNEGCEALPQKVSKSQGDGRSNVMRRCPDHDSPIPSGSSVYACGCRFQYQKEDICKPKGNHHPTVKPTDLMRYLCRLVTPAGGVVLDPFMGSGSTGKAAILEGFRFVGIEREIDYVEIAQSRIARCLGEKQEKELRPVVQDLFAEVE